MSSTGALKHWNVFTSWESSPRIGWWSRMCIPGIGPSDRPFDPPASHVSHVVVSIVMGVTPQWLVSKGKSYLEMDDLGAPVFQETPMYLPMPRFHESSTAFFFWHFPSGARSEKESFTTSTCSSSATSGYIYVYIYMYVTYVTMIFFWWWIVVTSQLFGFWCYAQMLHVWNSSQHLP